MRYCSFEKKLYSFKKKKCHWNATILCACNNSFCSHRNRATDVHFIFLIAHFPNLSNSVPWHNITMNSSCFIVTFAQFVNLEIILCIFKASKLIHSISTSWKTDVKLLLFIKFEHHNQFKENKSMNE